MILELYLSLVAISLIALGLGYFTSIPHYSFVGLFFLFLCGVFLFLGQVEYNTGSSVTTSYSYNGSTILSSTTTINDTLTSFSGTYARWFGVLLSVSSGFGLALNLYNFRLDKKLEEEEA